MKTVLFCFFAKPKCVNDHIKQKKSSIFRTRKKVKSENMWRFLQLIIKTGGFSWLIFAVLQHGTSTGLLTCCLYCHHFL